MRKAILILVIAEVNCMTQIKEKTWICKSVILATVVAIRAVIKNGFYHCIINLFFHQLYHFDKAIFIYFDKMLQSKGRVLTNSVGSHMGLVMWFTKCSGLISFTKCLEGMYTAQIIIVMVCSSSSYIRIYIWNFTHLNQIKLSFDYHKLFFQWKIGKII